MDIYGACATSCFAMLGVFSVKNYQGAAQPFYSPSALVQRRQKPAGYRFLDKLHAFPAVNFSIIYLKKLKWLSGVVKVRSSMQHDRPMMDRPCREISGKQWVRYCGCMWELEHLKRQCDQIALCSCWTLPLCTPGAVLRIAWSPEATLLAAGSPKEEPFVTVFLDTFGHVCFHCFSWPMFSPNHFRSGLEVSDI